MKRGLANIVVALLSVACRPAADSSPSQTPEPVPSETSAASESASGTATGSDDDGGLQGSPDAAEGGLGSPAAALDKDAVRRVVRDHVDDVRGCYEQGLKRDPTLAARVVIEFEIEPTGKVGIAQIVESDLPDPSASVGTCIVDAVLAWTFPAPPDGGDAQVTYPFILEPAATSARANPGRPPSGAWFPVPEFARHTVVVQVVDTEYEPIEGRRVQLRMKIDNATDEIVASTDDRGRARFEKIPAGTEVVGVVDPITTDTTTTDGTAIGSVLVVQRPGA
ncbi:MAG: AgmX/PglI C-terminal domain-containing protein [Myxococcota bacterium]